MNSTTTPTPSQQAASAEVRPSNRSKRRWRTAAPIAVTVLALVFISNTVPWRDRVHLDDGTVAIVLDRSATALTVQPIKQPDARPRTIASSPGQTIEPGVGTLLTDVKTSWLLVYIFCVAASSTLLITRWRHLLKHHQSKSTDSDIHAQTAPLWRWCAVIWARSQVINLLPLSQIGGDLYRIERSTRQLGDSAAAAGIIGAERTVGLVALALVAAVGLACSGLLPITPAAGIAILLGVCLAVGLTARFLTPRFASWLTINDASPRWITWLRRTASPLIQLATHPKRFFATLGLSLGVQLLTPLSFAVVDRALGMDTPVWCYLIAIPALNLAIFLPIHIAGIGILEGGLYLFLHQWAHLDTADVIAISVGARIMSLTWSAVLATGFLVPTPGRFAREHLEDHDEPVKTNTCEAEGRFSVATGQSAMRSACTVEGH